MQYKNIYPATFLSRPNRFIAMADINGKETVCHVKNTGRCRELLKPRARILLEKSENPLRKTAFDVVSVYKDDRLINLDSQAPNRLFFEWVQKELLFKNITLLRPETTYRSSRFDFYIETKKEKIFVEVKGVTLEKDNIALFPDAPTERGVKHINELITAMDDGYKAYIVFVIQMQGVNHFSPNDETHPAFGEALRKAAKAGVNMMALDCCVKPGEIYINKPVPIIL